ncbi:hypothetical protein OIU77_022162 [Salix suchowensis]|uniref:ENTH domain-containing protein n=1 Tax=Salix suchowensis TaxID=1278906 RepID=A0ABQ9C2W4_9ROSI|nr:hypothetical protein OIU77_022162 [Salix suchowensis]
MELRKAIGVVKDQTSISIAKVAANTSAELEVLVVKATSHYEDPADEKYYREIISLISSSRGYVNACVAAISRRISKTRDWIVSLKALMLIHRLSFLFFERKVREDERKSEEGGDGSGNRENGDDFEYGMAKRSKSYGDLGSREQKMEVTTIRQMKPERLLGILDQQSLEDVFYNVPFQNGK